VRRYRMPCPADAVFVGTVTVVVEIMVNDGQAQDPDTTRQQRADGWAWQANLKAVHQISVSRAETSLFEHGL